MASQAFFMRIAFMLLCITTPAAAAVQETAASRVQPFQERTYQGRPIEFWLKALRDRDEELMSTAFDAIYSLDEDAWIAVPDLEQVVAAPFVAIDIGKDSHTTIASKLYDIAVRSEAIETLAWIGESGAPATAALLDWALIDRVVPAPNRNSDNDDLFIELVIVDTEQRVQVAGAVAAFGRGAFQSVARLLTSSDVAKRKLAVAILSVDALPIAAELLHAEDCEAREIGLHVLKDMDLIVTPRYLDALTKQIREDCGSLTKIH